MAIRYKGTKSREANESKNYNDYKIYYNFMN